MNLPRLALIALLATSCWATSLHAATMIDGVPIPDELMALARKVVASNSPKDALMRGDNIFASHPFFKELVKKVNFQQVDEEAAKLMVQTFTRSELYALKQFQESAEGRSISLKMPAYQQMVGGLIQNQLKGAMEGYLASQAMKGGAQSEGVGAPATTAPTKPVVPWTPPTTPSAPTQPAVLPAVQGQGGSAIGQ
ncbi:MAG: hypothetical protein WAZ18_04875 [Alphaproteobacteria bacterium]